MTTIPHVLSLFAVLWSPDLAPQGPSPKSPGAAPAAGKSAPTFTQDVAPIVLGHCATCHRPGEVAPFPLLSFADVQKRGKMIRQVVDDRFMPPWHPEPGYGEFRNCLRLPDADVHTIDAWVEGGMAEGPKEALPAPFAGEPLEIGFNPEFLRDGIESVQSDEIQLKLISPLRPGLIQGEGDDYSYLIMPIRLAG